MPTERESVEAFIAGSGFPLEFFAADRLSRGGFTPRHGRTYASTDDDGDRVREIDILAELTDTRLARPASLVLECKHATSPWLVMAGERDPEPALRVIRVRGGIRPLEPRQARGVRDALGITAPLAFGLTAVRSREEGKREPRDQAFDAVRQLLSASAGAVGILPNGALVHPVLVVEGSLFRYEPGHGVDQVESARLVWWGAPTGPVPVVVDVVTRTGFNEAYVQDRRNDLIALAAVFGPYHPGGAASF